MKKKKKSLTSVVVILIVLIIGLAGFIVYDKVLNNKVISKDFYSNLVNNRETTYYSISGSPLNMLVDKNGDVYYAATSGYSINTNEPIKEYKIEDYRLSHDGSNIFHGYKLDISNVLMIYYGYTGQGGYGTFVFIKENGDVASLIIDQSLEKEVSIIKLEENNNLKNIVAVGEYDSFDGNGLKLIDINGNQYTIDGLKLNS